MSDILATLRPALADRYEIERELGAGGMATVYLVRDIKHDRQVALKVLRPELALVLGAERFLAEIRITARLDHPHILTLIDSGDVDGVLYYVLPYVRGESLRDKLTREQQLSIPEALAITRQVASALDHAHKQGVIHRDIKPENILLHEGEAMLADFGIALAVKEAGGSRLTETGLSLGTPQYMSPEQATGERQPTARSDIYSLAAVLYEMLAGEPPVTGPNAQAMIAKLLTEKPISLRVVRNTVPESVNRAVEQALSKVPADRFASTAEFVKALDANDNAERKPSNHPSFASATTWRKAAPWFVAVTSVAAILFLVWYNKPAPRLELGRSDQLTAELGLEIQPAISPDGKLVAYASGNSARMRVFIRPVGGGRTIPLSDDSTAVETHPRWSPDGSSLLFLARNGVSVAPALGGTSNAIISGTDVHFVTSAAWSPDGREIAFIRNDSVLVSPVDGGAARLVGTGPYELHSAAWSPDGRWIACIAGNSESVFPGPGFSNIAPSRLVLFPAIGGAATTLFPSHDFTQSPVWTDDSRRILFVSNRDGPRDVYALSLSSSGKPNGAPVRMTTGLGAISISLTERGKRLVYAVYFVQANIWSLPVPTGAPTNTQGATQLTTSHQVVEYLTISHDGRWLLFDSDLKGNADLYRMPIGGGPAEQLTSDSAAEFGPDLSPDGRSVAFHTWRRGTRDVVVKSLDGGAIEDVVAGPSQASFPAWSPDGNALTYFDQLPPYGVFVVRRKPAGGWSAPTMVSALIGVLPQWSPDGREIAFSSGTGVTVATDIYVVPAVGGTERKVYGGTPGLPAASKIIWSRDGKTLFFKAHDVHGQTSFWSIPSAGGTPRLLVRFDDASWQSNRPFFTTDGKRFYFPVENRQSDIFVAQILAR